jgi:hypothetical protein
MKKKVLTVDFMSGSTYEYDEVEPGVFKGFKIAVKKKESVGKLFSSLVKGKYQFRKVTNKA